MVEERGDQQKGGMENGLKGGQHEVELTPINGFHDDTDALESGGPVFIPEQVAETDATDEIESSNSKMLPTRTIALISIVGAGIQFGWALQLSLLTPYVETLGIPHAWVSFIWLCGPISGLLVQPCIGVWSDNCDSRYGRRRPFILGGAILVGVSVLLIGFSADLGYALGDSRYLDQRTRPFACTLFIVGFWCLDLSNNTVQGPSRALLADLAGSDQQDAANAMYSLWTAVGNILGYSTGAIGSWHKWFPGLTSKACGEPCANLKAAFMLAVLFLSLCTTICLYSAKEKPWRPRRGSDAAHLNGDESHEHILEGTATGQESRQVAVQEEQAGLGSGPGAIVVNLLVGLRSLPAAMKIILLVMALTWTAWFPFLLFDTDWMGREVFLGEPGALSDTSRQARLYQQGVHYGSLGLLLNSIVQAVTSIFIDPLCRRIGSKNVWAAGNLVISACMATTFAVSTASVNVAQLNGQPVLSHPQYVKGLAVAIFAVLGAPFAITFSVPYSLTAEFTSSSGGGQGLAMGILNLAIVVPQIFVALGAGPWDALFGGSNQPAFAAAAVFALAAGFLAFLLLPRPQRQGGYVTAQSGEL